MKTLSDLSESEQIVIGENLAELFQMKKDKQGHWKTAVGTKTSLGLCRLFERAADNIQGGSNLDDWF